jgi:hypothetical protein
MKHKHNANAPPKKPPDLEVYRKQVERMNEALKNPKFQVPY